MKCVILAAGYATRLYPLTKDMPKPLLDVGGKPILARILDKVERLDVVDEAIIVTNDRFYHRFREWVNGYSFGKPITVLNDGSSDNGNRLDAIADLQYAVEEEGLDDDLLVLAGDNLFDFELTGFVEFFRRTGKDSITVHELHDVGKLKRTGVVVIDETSRVLSFEEKPDRPRSNLEVPPFYIYKRETLPLLNRYLAEGNDGDAPGNFIPWLLKHREVYAFKFAARRYDIGTPESYREAQNIFAEQD